MLSSGCSLAGVASMMMIRHPLGKSRLSDVPRMLRSDVFAERLNAQVVDPGLRVEMHVLPGVDVPRKCHVLERTGKCRGGVDRIGDGIERQRG